MKHYHHWETIPGTYLRGDKLGQWLRMCTKCGKTQKIIAYKGQIISIIEVETER
jgi:glutaredoxin-related protein